MNSVSPKAKRITVKRSNLRGLLTFGDNNMFPQQLIDMCSDSVTATACLQARARFIQGNGFTDTEIAKLIIHRSGQTLDTLLNRVSKGVSWFETIVIHVGYNGNGQIASLRPINVEFIRLCEPDDMGVITHAAICPYLDGVYNQRKRNLFTKLPLFNPDPNIVQEQIIEAGGIDQYHGQLLYEPFWDPGDGFYHHPSFLTAIEAIESEAKLGTYNWNAINNGFNVSGILSIISNKEVSSTYDPMLDETSIEYQISANQGEGNAAAVMVMRFKSEAEAAATKWTPFSGADLAKRYEYTSDWAKQEITTAMQTPNELVNVRRSGGIAPTGDEIIVCSQLVYQTVNPWQRRIMEIFQLLFRYWKEPIKSDFKIENLDYFKGLSTSKATKADDKQVAQAG